MQVDAFESALEKNVEIEFERNQERYAFTALGPEAFDNFQVVPPRTRHRAPGQPQTPLARVVMTAERSGETWAYPDTVFGTSNTHHDDQRPRRARLGRRRHQAEAAAMLASRRRC